MRGAQSKSSDRNNSSIREVQSLVHIDISQKSFLCSEDFCSLASSDTQVTRTKQGTFPGTGTQQLNPKDTSCMLFVHGHQPTGCCGGPQVGEKSAGSGGTPTYCAYRSPSHSMRRGHPARTADLRVHRHVFCWILLDTTGPALPVPSGPHQQGH